MIGAKFALPGRIKWLATGVDANISIPVGNRTRGFSTDSWDPSITALFTVPLPESNTFTSAALHFNLGFRAFGDQLGRGYMGPPGFYLEPVYPDRNKSRLDARAAIELGSRDLTLFAELVLDRILSQRVAWRESPLFLTPGLRMSLGDSWSLLLASKVSIATDDGEGEILLTPDELFPDWQLAFGLTWSRQGPDVDRDGDGVPDWRDRCPRLPEDFDGWEDADGCPDPDNDGDGVPDAFDLAPGAPEDFDGFHDTDGVPDPDNDGDGIPDEEDLCALRAEDFDGVADEDGCPEKDADGDGIPDEDDACPEEAETIDGIDDEDGCPDKIGGADPFLLRSILWESASVAPRTVSYFELNKLAESMRADDDLKIELRVHVRGAAGGVDLARRRAEYLKGFLVAAGVSPHRVSAIAGEGGPIQDSPYSGPGFGEERSLAEVIPLTEESLADQ